MPKLPKKVEENREGEFDASEPYEFKFRILAEYMYSSSVGCTCIAFACDVCVDPTRGDNIFFFCYTCNVLVLTCLQMQFSHPY